MMRIFFVVAAALLAGACHEIPQDARKPFAGRAERQLYDRDRFADEASFEEVLAARTRTQNESVRMGDDKTR